MQFIRFTDTFTCIFSRAHASLFVILTIIGSVCKYCTYTDLGIQRFENLVIADKHRNRLHSKQRIKLSIKCGFIEIVKDKSRNLLHPSLVIIINNFVAMIILHEEAKHIFIGNSIFDEIFMQAITENFFCCMPVHCIFGKDRCSRKAKNSGIIEELHNLLMTIPKMTTMTLIENHHDA